MYLQWLYCIIHVAIVTSAHKKASTQKATN
jgi:hypothetical protein